MFRALFLLLPLTTLLGCTDKADEDDDGPVDDDGDGFEAQDDCDDKDDSINPDAEELCDGVDNNCDGEIDEGDATGALTWFADSDGDGFGDAASTLTACDQPADHVADDTDCDDGDEAVNPGADELCATEGVDDDCDGDVDESDAADATTWYRDSDKDGYGDPDSDRSSCEALDGYVDNGDDCVDDQSSISPMAAEMCDGLDNDCDGEVDEDDAVDAVFWYTDADHDGYGDPSTGARACEADEWQTEDNTDCDDSEPTVYPDAPAICDDLDNDCDGDVDDGWRVPSDYADIQTALDAASGGETICVQAGTYTETIDFSGKAVALVGTEGSEYTVIDGDGVGPVVSFQSGEGAGSELSGFTITGGDATYGAGVYVDGASPSLMDLVMEGNTCTASTCYGTGLYVDQGDPLVLQVELNNNTCVASSNCNGVGGYFAYSDGVIQGLRSTGNTADAGSTAHGVGLYFGSYTTLEASQVEVLGNSSTGGAWVLGAGVTFISRSTVALSNSIVAGNTGEALITSGAAHISNSSSPTFENVVVHGNSVEASYASYASGVGITGTSSASFINVAITGNTASGSGDRSDSAGLWVAGSLSLSYSDLYGNDDADIYGMTDPTGTDGNISVDPGFTDVSSADPLAWDLTLGSSSALMDAGDPSLSDPDGSTSDIGAYGGAGAADWGWSATIEQLRDGTVSEGYVVTVSEVVVTGVSYYGFTVQDPNATAPEYSGITVFLGEPHSLARGMELTIEGELYDYFGLAELLVDLEDIVITGTSSEPAPVELTLAEAMDEAWEGVLVTVTDGSLDDAAYDCSADSSYCDDDDLWTLTDGSDALVIYDLLYDSDDWTDQIGVSPLTGVMSYNYYRYRLMPRSTWDF